MPAVSSEAPLFDQAGVAAPQVPPRARSRLKTVGYPALPLDLGEYYAANLTAYQYGVLVSLLVRIWHHGELPVGVKALAAIPKVGVQAFARMLPAIAPHFDIDENGRWRHYDLEEKRDADLAMRDKRAKSGAVGARQRWAKDDVGPDDPPLPGGTGATGVAMANGMANAIGGVPAGDTKTPVFAMPVAMPVATPNAMLLAHGDASDADGLIDRFSSYEDDKRSIESARELGGDAIPDAKPDAIPDAKPEGGAPGLPANQILAEASLDDAALAATLRAASAKIPPILLNKTDMTPIRAMMADGCDLRRDIVPAIVNFADGCRTPLRSFLAKQIREKVLASRDSAQKSALPAATTDWCFVVEDSPSWRAWLIVKGVSRHFAYQSKSGIDRGYAFPTQWPPGWDAARLASIETT